MEKKHENSLPIKMTKIDYIIIALIFALAAAFGLYIYFEPPNDRVFNLNYLIWITEPLACGILSLIIAKRYWHYKVFGKSYLSLGLGFLFYTGGVVIWAYYLVARGTVDYPSIADVSYLIYEPLVMMHLVINIRQFKQNIAPIVKIGVAAISVAITAIFLIVVFTYNQGIVVSFSDIGFDISLLYVVAAAVIFSLALLGFNFSKILAWKNMENTCCWHIFIYDCRSVVRLSVYV